MVKLTEIKIIGGGLAGSEAAWQAAEAGCRVKLFEMRPQIMTPVHKTEYLAELVCSNSLRSASLENAVGLLKEEMRRMNSLIMAKADSHAIPAGGALAVDREAFSAAVTAAIEKHPNIQRYEKEITEIPDTVEGPVIIATGPLTSEALAADIGRLTGQESLFFYDAVAPIVTAGSIDQNKVFRASRYGKGTADYLNCPLDREEYERFYEALTTAETHDSLFNEEKKYFEGCMPLEVMAARGFATLRYGPLKPVGLTDPRTNKQPYAVVQLRQDNAAASLYNLVGFQTRLRWPEQKRVFRMIPGLENAEFVRYGVMHRNTYINSPLLLSPTLQSLENQKLFFAGQITGVEGYVESAAMGLLAGINAARLAKGKQTVTWPVVTAHGALAHYITAAGAAGFQPMNINFGLIPPLENHLPKKSRKKALVKRALNAIDRLKKEMLA